MDKLALTVPTNDAQGRITSTSVPAPSGLPTNLTGGLNQTIVPLISTILNLLFMGGVILAVIFLLIGGIRYITSGGDPNKIHDARNTLMYSILGLVIILAAYFIVNGILFLLGAKPRFFWNLGQIN